jgi:vancomycin resistance protein YoaR
MSEKKTKPTVTVQKMPKAEKATTKRAKAEKPAKSKKVSALDAAARVLGETRQAMNCMELIEAMAAKNYWTSPKGKTPHATLYAAMLREIRAKGKDARFKKSERGKFTLANREG